MTIQKNIDQFFSFVTGDPINREEIKNIHAHSQFALNLLVHTHTCTKRESPKYTLEWCCLSIVTKLSLSLSVSMNTQTDRQSIFENTRTNKEWKVRQNKVYRLCVWNSLINGLTFSTANGVFIARNLVNQSFHYIDREPVQKLKVNIFLQSKILL